MLHQERFIVKIGDLVRAKANFLGIQGWRLEKEGVALRAVGLVVKARPGAIDPDHMSYRVRWSGDHGTFWSCIQDLEVIHEDR